jgi:soluble lytic murein transglycosylase-like protein
VLRALALFVCALALAGRAFAGAQQYEPLAASVRAGLAASITDRPAPHHGFTNAVEAVNWLTEMSARLERRIPDFRVRLDFLRTVHYEALRAGLDPQLLLALIQVESNFRKYAVSGAGARGYMQVMPFWTELIGRRGDNLFNLRINLRYGCVILRHYLDIEKGNVERALARYNGSLGKPEYPRMVFTALKGPWRYGAPLTVQRQQPKAPYPGNSPAMVSCTDCAAPRGSGALRIGLPITM